MNLILKAVRHISPARYVRLNISRIEREIHKLKTAGFADCRVTRTVDENNKIGGLTEDRHEFEEWKQELDDKTLAKKAAKI